MRISCRLTAQVCASGVECAYLVDFIAEMPKMSNERKALLRVLEMYKNKPGLWDKNHPNYYNKHTRLADNLELLKVYKEYDPWATMTSMCKKIQNLKTNYFLHLQKLKESRLCIPTLWYFHAMSFLTESNDYSNIKRDSVEIEISSDEEKDHETSDSCATPPTEEQKVTEGAISQSKHIDEESIDEPSRIKEWAILGRSIGLQLRNLEPKQLTITQKLISDAIYYANFGLLTHDSHIALGKEPPS